MTPRKTWCGPLYYTLLFASIVCSLAGSAMLCAGVPAALSLGVSVLGLTLIVVAITTIAAKSRRHNS